MTTTGDVRLGLIGAGRWGRNYIASIASLPGTRLVAVASRNPATAKLVQPDCRIVADWQRIVGSSDIDGVVVASPPATHAEILTAAILADKAVMIEKPVVASHQDVRTIRQLLAKRAATILVDHIHIYDQAFRALRKAVDEIGHIRSIRSSAGNFGPYRKDVSVLWDWAPHDIAMCLTMCPGQARPVGIARTGSRSIDGALAETIDLQLDAAGIDVRIHLSTLEPRHRWFAVQLDECTLVYRDDGARTLARFNPDEDIRSGGQIMFSSPEPPLTRALTEFSEAIRSRSADRQSIDLGLTTVELIADFDMLTAGNRDANQDSAPV